MGGGLPRGERFEGTQVLASDQGSEKEGEEEGSGRLKEGTFQWKRILLYSREIGKPVKTFFGLGSFCLPLDLGSPSLN